MSDRTCQPNVVQTQLSKIDGNWTTVTGVWCAVERENTTDLLRGNEYLILQLASLHKYEDLLSRINEEVQHRTINILPSVCRITILCLCDFSFYQLSDAAMVGFLWQSSVNGTLLVTIVYWTNDISRGGRTKTGIPIDNPDKPSLTPVSMTSYSLA